MTIDWSERALDDLDTIIFHVAAENVTSALWMDSDISRRVDLLSDFPSMGRAGRIFGTPELVVSRSRCVVLYRLDDDMVRILRVVHGAQKWPESI